MNEVARFQVREYDNHQYYVQDTLLDISASDNIEDFDEAVSWAVKLEQDYKNQLSILSSWVQENS